MKYYANELYHWGIKGQKWGIRRYQNSDGTLTSEGKIRYGYKEDDPDLINKKQEVIKTRNKEINYFNKKHWNSKYDGGEYKSKRQIAYSTDPKYKKMVDEADKVEKEYKRMQLGQIKRGKELDSKLRFMNENDIADEDWEDIYVYRNYENGKDIAASILTVMAALPIVYFMEKNI